MISKPSIFSGLAATPLSTLSRPRLVFSLVALSLYGGLAALALPRILPRALGVLWGPLPRYELQLRGGDSCLRCADPAHDEPALPALEPTRSGTAALSVGPAGALAAQKPAAVVRLDAPLTIVLRPVQPVAGPVFVQAFLGHAGGTATWPLVMERAGDGTLALRGLVREVLDLAPHELGRYELLFVVQRSPLPLLTARLGRGDAPPGAQLLRGELTVLPPAAPARP